MSCMTLITAAVVCPELEILMSETSRVNAWGSQHVVSRIWHICSQRRTTGSNLQPSMIGCRAFTSALPERVNFRCVYEPASSASDLKPKIFEIEHQRKRMHGNMTYCQFKILGKSDIGYFLDTSQSYLLEECKFETKYPFEEK